MRSTFKLLFYINRGKVKADGTTAVMCRISIDGKNSALTTGIYCQLSDWNAKKGEIRTERENNRLAEFRVRLEQTYDHILREQGAVSAELLKNTIVGVNSTPTMLLEAGEVERERLRLRSIEINSTSTYRQAGISQKNLREFLHSRGKEDIAFEDITEEFGELFKIFLKSTRERRGKYINKCLTWLNRLIYIAVDQDVMRCNPLEEVEYEKNDPPKIRHIGKSDLKRMMETPFEDPMMELARRAFIFSSLTALAYVDIYGLYPRHIGKTAAGRLYIRKQRVKTKVEAFIPLHPIAERILMLYNTTDDSRPVFPLPIRDILWHEVHQIGIVLGLKENLSYHVSRHSCGTLMLSAGISIESIAKMMGHANISTTQGYAQVTDLKISEDMDRLMARREATAKDRTCGEVHRPRGNGWSRKAQEVASREVGSVSSTGCRPSEPQSSEGGILTREITPAADLATRKRASRRVQGEAQRTSADRRSRKVIDSSPAPIMKEVRP